MKRIKLPWMVLLYTVLLSICVFNVLPTYDDWSYAAPKLDVFDWRILLPTRIFWRPFDRLIEVVLGAFPALFPWLNHTIVLCAHFLLCLILYKSLLKITKDKANALWFTLFFCFSPGIVPVVSQTDAINISYSLLMGVLACVLFFHSQDQDNRNRIWCRLGYFCTAMMSVLFKENGIVWFTAPVFFHLIWEYAFSNASLFELVKKHTFPFFSGLCGCAGYFVIRFSLMHEIALGDGTGAYMINFSPLNILKNYMITLAGSCAALDSLALLGTPRKFGLFLCSVAASVPFISVVLTALWRLQRNRRAFVVIVGIFFGILGVAAPYVVMNHVAEMSVYPTVFLFSIMWGVLFSVSPQQRTFLKASLGILFAGMLLTSGHKFVSLWDYTHEVRRYLAGFSSLFAKQPQNVLVYYVEDVPLNFSLYRQPLGFGIARGEAFRSLWNWTGQIHIKMLKQPPAPVFKSQDNIRFDTVLILSQSGNVKVLKNSAFQE